MFKIQPGIIYRKFRSPRAHVTEIPDKTETQAFWENIWGLPQRHSTEAASIRNIEEQNTAVHNQETTVITEEDITNRSGRSSTGKPLDLTKYKCSG